MLLHAGVRIITDEVRQSGSMFCLADSLVLRFERGYGSYK